MKEKIEFEKYIEKNKKKNLEWDKKPIIFYWIENPSMNNSINAIEKKCKYLIEQKDEIKGGTNKLEEWLFGSDLQFYTITAERFIIDYLKERNGENLLDNLQKSNKSNVDAALRVNNETIGIEITTINSFIADWIFKERLSIYLQERYKDIDTLEIEYSPETIKHHQIDFLSNNYEFIKEVGLKIIKKDIKGLKELGISVTYSNRPSSCVVWRHTESNTNKEMMTVLTEDILKKKIEGNKKKKKQLSIHNKNLLFVGINQLQDEYPLLPNIFDKAKLSLENYRKHLRDYYSNHLPDYLSGICFFFYYLEQKKPFYPLEIFWRKKAEKIKINL